MFFHALPNYEIAKQIASLINVHNGLSLKRRSVDIIESRINYVVETHGKLVIGAVGIDRISFAFSEIKHLVVLPEWRRKGVGKFVTKQALDLVETPLIYCTIREDNGASVRLFESLGFTRADKYLAGNHDVVLLTRPAPTWRKRCSKPTWKSRSSAERTLPSDIDDLKPSSYLAMTPLLLEDDI